MPLDVMIPMVVIGIAGIGVLTYLLGWAKPVSFAVPEDAMRAWAENFPDGPAPTSAVVAGDGRAALVETEEGPGLIWAMGQDCAARLLAAADVTPTKKGLRVDFHDFGTPPVQVALDGARDADAWRAILTGTDAETSNA